MGSVLIEQVEVGVLNLDNPEVQGQLVLVNETVMTIGQMRGALKPKEHSKVRSEAATLKHFYDSIIAEDKEKTVFYYHKLLQAFSVKDLMAKLDHNGLRLSFDLMVGVK